MYFYQKIVRPLFRQAQAKLGDLNAILQDNLSGIREIQVFTQEEREYRRVSEGSTPMHGPSQKPCP